MEREETRGVESEEKIAATNQTIDQVLQLITERVGRNDHTNLARGDDAKMVILSISDERLKADQPTPRARIKEKTFNHTTFNHRLFIPEGAVSIDYEYIIWEGLDGGHKAITRTFEATCWTKRIKDKRRVTELNEQGRKSILASEYASQQLVKYVQRLEVL